MFKGLKKIQASSKRVLRNSRSVLGLKKNSSTCVLVCFGVLYCFQAPSGGVSRTPGSVLESQEKFKQLQEEFQGPEEAFQDLKKNPRSIRRSIQ